MRQTALRGRPRSPVAQGLVDCLAAGATCSWAGRDPSRRVELWSANCRRITPVKLRPERHSRQGWRLAASSVSRASHPAAIARSSNAVRSLNRAPWYRLVR